MVDTIERAREAMARHNWVEAEEAFAAADRDGGLEAADLELFGTAAWWAGNPDTATEVLERTVGAYADAGQPVAAANVALALAYQAFRRRAEAIGGAWVGRAQHLLEGEPESSAHVRIMVYAALGELMAGRFNEGIALTDQTMESARRLDEPSSLYLAMSFKGMAKVFAGDWKAGLALVDEAAAAAASGRLDLRVASDIYCNTIAACRNAGDLQRAGQWAEEGQRWMRDQGVGGYAGICRVHRAELKMFRGQWAEAEQEARHACAELEQFRLLDSVGYAHYQVGEVRLRMGDLDAAAEAFDLAYAYGHDAQPGLALLQLARGELDEAARSIARALTATVPPDGQTDRTTRGRLLPAQIDIALARRDFETAGHSVAELEQIAADFRQPLHEASALTARGEFLLSEDHPAEASPLLGRSWRLWQATDLPYEAARARLRYAEALAAEGDAMAARRDLQAARSTFDRLGAALDVRRVDALLGEGAGPPAPEVKRTVRTFMFTDIVTSTDLIGLIGDEAWGALLRWHDRELRSAFAQHRGEEVRHTGDGFFVAFERATDGLECAVDIQRRLARHRRDEGFAPTVRIGLHTAEAGRRGDDYLGHGVHVAARIGAAAAREEILVSGTVLEATGTPRFGLSEPRELTLKGVDGTVAARSVDWR